MNIIDKARKAKSLAGASTIPRVIATLAGGSLGQKAVVILGLGLMAIGIYKLITSAILPFILCAVGGVLIWVSMKDYERAKRYADL